jgi:ketosteroid isomerase-like protein
VDDTAEVRAAVEDLFAAIVRKDVEAIQSRYLHDERLLIFLEGWEGKIEGFDRDANAAAWRGLLDGVTFTRIALSPDVRAGRDGALGWVGGTIESTYRPAGGGEPVDVEQRGTWILEHDDGRWVIVFEHVSFPAEHPYGAAALG